MNQFVNATSNKTYSIAVILKHLLIDYSLNEMDHDTIELYLHTICEIASGKIQKL